MTGTGLNLICSIEQQGLQVIVIVCPKMKRFNVNNL